MKYEKKRKKISKKFYSTDSRMLNLSKSPKKQRQPTPQRRTRRMLRKILPLGTCSLEEHAGPRNTCTHLQVHTVNFAIFIKKRKNAERIEKREVGPKTFTADGSLAQKKKGKVNKPLYSPINNIHNANTWDTTPNGIANLFILTSNIGISE